MDALKTYSFPLGNDLHDPQNHALEVFSSFHHQPYSLFFDSADRDHSAAQYSYIAFHPFETIEVKNGIVFVTNTEQQLSIHTNPFIFLKERLELYELDLEPLQNLPPFQGGAAGYFGYDLGQEKDMEKNTETEHDIPDMAIGLYNQIVSFDHEKKKAWHVVLAKNEQEAENRHSHFKKIIAASGNVAIKENDFTVEWKAECPESEYLAKIEDIIGLIRKGNIFQANLSHRYSAGLTPEFDSFAHYCHLRKINPAPFASYMNFGAVRLSSCSPERFLSVKERKVIAQPIKGTRARHKDAVRDKMEIDTLCQSGKDRAENVMIVDLMRSDLSKVCEEYSIKVPQLCNIESFASVHHLVSTVTGTLKIDQTPTDLLQACFPGGSITGVPKTRAMEIVAYMEPHQRGPYGGAMGFIGFDGTMDTNMTIRTLVYNKDEVSFSVGTAITADSQAETEYQITLDKASAIFQSFESEERRRKIA